MGAVVVARWFGGVMLGPARFEMMRSVAKDAVGQYKKTSHYNNTNNHHRGGEGKRAKLDSTIANESGMVRRKDVLVKLLRERDSSISILRGLLAEKKGVVGGQERPKTGFVAGVREVGYEGMELKVLERLEQVRDKTIGWILKEIEKVEGVEREGREIVVEAAEGRLISDGAKLVADTSAMVVNGEKGQDTGEETPFQSTKTQKSP